MSKKTKIILIVVGIFIFVLCLICSMVIINSKNNKETNEEILYSTTYYFGFGSRRIRIYTNGDIYDDLEIENPNHKPDYKYLKTLTKNEINDLKYKIENEPNSEAIKDYIIELVYGVKEFDNFGNY